MTRDEVQAAITKLRDALRLVELAETSFIRRERMESLLLEATEAVRMLTEALEKSGAVSKGDAFRRIGGGGDEGEILTVTKIASRPVRVVGRGVVSWTCESNLNDPTMYERVTP
jgi:hypothetical protein